MTLLGSLCANQPEVEIMSLVIAQAVTDVCGVDSGAVCTLVFDLTGSTDAARLADLAARPVKVLIILAAAWGINRFIKRWLDRAVEGWLSRRASAAEKAGRESSEASGDGADLKEVAVRRARLLIEQQERTSQRTRTLGALLRSISTIVIYGLAAMMSLAEFDVNLGPLIAGAGIVGVAVGFGAQSLVRDFLSGMFMLLEDQYGVGDVVDFDGTAGVVEEIKLRTTQLRDINGTLWHIPNGEIRRVANMSHDWSRAVLDIEVAYDTDLTAAITVIKAVAYGLYREQLPDATITEEPAVVGVQGFGESAVVIRLMAKTEAGEQWATARELRIRLKDAFDKAGIEIPFPQRTLWVKGDNRLPGSESAGSGVSVPTTGG